MRRGGEDRSGSIEGDPVMLDELQTDHARYARAIPSQFLPPRKELCWRSTKIQQQT